MNRVVRAVGFTFFAVAAACSESTTTVLDPLVAPEASEPLTVGVTTREQIAGERLPTTHVAVAARSVAFDVTRVGGCLPAVTAAVGRHAGVLAVVARVSNSALANCVGGAVTIYGGVITGVAPGPYRVDVFEANGEGIAEHISSTVVTVP